MKKILYLLLYIAFLPLLAGCIHEHPDDGGTDPTLLTVEVGLTLNLEWEDYQSRSKAAVRSAGSYTRRFIVEVRRGGQTVHKQTVIATDFAEGQTEFTLPEPIELHALEYTVAVWSDYTDAQSEDGLYYDAANLNAITLRDPYAGNTDYRDCHYAVSTLDLRSYRNQWNARVQLDVAMVRPLAKYRIVATDVQEFREVMQKKFPGRMEFGIRFSYSFYLPVAFNVWEGKPSESRSGVAFDGTLSLPDDDSEELLLGSDYIFVNGEGSYIPLSVEISVGGELVGRFTGLNVPYRRGYVTTLRGRFLTAMSGSGGIGIDLGYDGDIDIDLDNF